MGKDYGKKDGDYKKDDYKKDDGKDKKDVEPSAEFKAAAKACTENKLCKQLMECMKKHADSGGKGDGKGKGDHEEVCVEEMKACAADKECSLLHAKLLHYKLQEAKKDGKDGGKDGYGKDGDKKGDYEGKKGDYDAKKKDEDHGRRRQLDQHGQKPPMKKDGEGKKDDGKKDYEKKGDDKKDYEKKDDGKKDGDYKKDDGKKDGDYKKDDGKDKKDMEPSAEFKAAAKACTENKLCKQLMECMKKHADSGGK